MNPILLIIPIGFGLGYWVLRGRAMSQSQIDVERLLESRITSGVNWSNGVVATRDQRLGNAKIIVSEFLQAGYSPRMALAGSTNAIAESQLANTATGDGGASVGLFQLHEKGGGRGLTVEQRQNPVINTQRIISELRAAYRNSWQGYRSLADAEAAGADVGELAGLFAVHVERPADRAGEYVRRRDLARQLWGSV